MTEIVRATLSTNATIIGYVEPSATHGKLEVIVKISVDENEYTLNSQQALLLLKIREIDKSGKR